MKNFKYMAPTSLKQATTLKKNETTAVVIAGGTDLLGTLKDRIHAESPETMLDLKTIPGLCYVKEDKKCLRIGALTTLREIATNRSVKEKYNLLALAARTVASPQIRNMGTIGGNICQEPRCWYYRAPDNQFHCLRKGGTKCGAAIGDNRYHSLFGGVRISTPACTHTCPGHVEIAAYMSKIRNGEIDQAAEIILSHNPLPAMTGRVCPHLCESACNRHELDESVSIRNVERFVGDSILEHSAEFMKAPKKQTKKKIAVVGSGPAGLSAAFYLRKLGHTVTVFEKMAEAGGMLTYCIPGYRLPKDLVKKQITALEKMGIRFELNVEIGKKGKTLRDLKKGFSGVFLATGAWRQNSIQIEKSELLTSGMDFLVKIEECKKTVSDQKVLVIGGGNVAIDVALSALRMGAKEVTMACLEDREHMPAFPEDIEEAIQEGVRILPSYGPHWILESGGKVTGMEFNRCTKVFDDQGRFSPSFDLKIKETIQADRIILATGQSADTAYTEKLLEKNKGWIVVHPETNATNMPGVFAGGDVTSGPASVIAAIGAGRNAAMAIDRTLYGKSKKETSAPCASLSDALETSSDCYNQCARTSGVPAALSKSLIAEECPTWNAGTAQAEAKRCLNCGCLAVNASDLAPALVALDAKIRTTKRVIPAEDFFSYDRILDQDEIIHEIEIPANPQKGQQSYQKFRIRNAIDFPIVSLASVLHVDNERIDSAKIVLGAVAPAPLRMKAVEEFLKGKAATEAVAREAGEIAVKSAMPLARNGFKKQIVRALIKKAILGI